MRTGKRMWKRFAPVWAFILIVLLLINGCSDADPPAEPVIIDPADGIEHAVTLDALMGHLEALENIGSRAAGSTGYDDAVAHMRQLLAKTNLVVTEQEFPFRYYEETMAPSMAQTSPAATDFTPGTDFVTMTYSGAGDVSGDLVFVTPMIPPGPDPNTSDDGCEPADFDGIDLNGNIAVLQRGGCTYAEKALNAQENGAAAVIIFNEGQTGRTETLDATLGENSQITIPVVGVGYALAETWFNASQSSTVGMRVVVERMDENRTAANLLAETPGGNGDQVILAGAHLDSVSAGPGINDNGTGAAALLELAYQVGTLDYTPVNKMRFAWWTAKEEGMVGSDYYAFDLDSEETASIAMYLNLDSIGSVNYVFGVLDSDLSDTADASDPTLDPDYLPPGSTEIEAAFTAYFTSQGLAARPMPLAGTPDYNPFINIGIPVGGLCTGEDGIKTQEEADTFGGAAGEPYDPCYHMACDDLDNIDQTALLTNARAITHVAQQFADQAVLFEGNTAARGPMARKAASGSRTRTSLEYDRFHGDRHLRSSE